jgi:LPXTG-motif cell wall-anchored protein
VIALVVGFIVYRSKWQPVKSNWIRTQLAQVIFFSLIAVIGYHLFSSHGFKQTAQKAQQNQLKAAQGRARQVKPQKTRPSNTGGASFDWTLAIGLCGLILVGGALYYIRARSRPMPRPLEIPEDVKAELSAALSDAIEDLRNEPDARRAVIAAYARMEGVLARRGHARHPAETPFEYLSRILLSLRVRGGAVRELTDLFERAKFSAHEIDDTMKERAISSLVSVREDLRPAAAAA